MSARALHLLVLWGFAVAQPLLDLLGRFPQFFVAQNARPVEIVTLVLALCFALPALLVSIEWLARYIAPPAARALHALLIALLAAAIFLQWLRRFGDLPGMLWIAIALALGAVTAVTYGRSTTFRTYLSILAPAPLVFAVAFLFFSPAEGVVRPAPRAAPAPVAITAEIPVVMVVFDELSLPTLMDSSHRIDAERYPNFAALSATSHWFRNATSTADFTILALPALLTGRYLGETTGHQQLATAASYPNNLFTLLGGAYQLNVYETLTDLCPHGLCPPTEIDAPAALRLRQLLIDAAVVYPHSVLPADLAARLPAITDQWGRFAAIARKHHKRVGWREIRRKPWVFASFLDAIRAAPHRKTLHFLHSGLPHVPWQYLPSGSCYGHLGSDLLVTRGLQKGQWAQDPWSAAQGFQRYLLQLGFVDRLLGDLLATLEEIDLLDSALVIVTADHGTSFRPGESRRGASRENFADIMSVPLFVKLPHQRKGAISDRNVELIDILPTLAGVLGFEVPWPTDGDSALDHHRPERPEKRIYRPYNPRGHLVFDPTELDARFRIADRMLELFGPGSDPSGIYRIGPHGDLVGRSLAELEIAGKAKAEVRLQAPELFQDIDPARLFPARILGEILSPDLASGPLQLAVAINGTVQAATRTVKTEAGAGRAPFTAMVAETAFSPGDNQVEVFVVTGSIRKPRLVPTRSR